MARRTDKGISGAVGNVIFYTMNGGDYIRAKPGKRKRKKGAPPNPLNTIFGIVSSNGTAMIKRMKNSLFFHYTRGTYNRGRGWLRNQYAVHGEDANWELSESKNRICQLNDKADLRDFIGAEIKVSNKGDGLISVLIPGLNPKKELKAPSRTAKVNIKIIGLASPFRERGFRGNLCIDQYKFDYTDNIIPAKEVILDTKAATGDIAIVTIALEFEILNSGSNTYNADQRWLPAAIIAMGRL